jgi:hypothetical protein
MSYSHEWGLSILGRIPDCEMNHTAGETIKWSDYPVKVDELSGYQRIIQAFYGDSGVNHDKHHGQDHILRGCIHTLKLSKYFQGHGVQLDPVVAIWSYLFHDVGSNHFDMPDHGDRGANIIKSIISSEYPSHQARQIISNVQWHNKPLESIPSEVLTIEHAIMRTADSLELFRLRDDRDIKLILGEAIGLAPLAEEFICRTTMNEQGKEFDSVLKTALEIGLVVA